MISHYKVMILLVYFIVLIALRFASVKAIIGGIEPPLKSWPFIVRLEIIKNIKGDIFPYYCSGTIITSDSILTAAHCLYTGDPLSPVLPINIKIYYGVNANMTDHPIIALTYKIHDNYDDGKKDNDIAIIRTLGQIPIADAKGYPVQSIKITANTNRFPVGTSMNIAGWGETNANDDSSSNVLLSTNVVIGADNDCVGANPSFIQDPNPPYYFPLICTSASTTNGFCTGDDGGPLIVIDNTKKTLGVALVGIISSEQANPPETIVTCGDNVLGFYDNLPYYKDFILQYTVTSWAVLTST